jgi:hypothetical protein
MITLFLSHASEDKDDFVRPLAERLSKDFEVWYDEYTLTLGDSLLQEINKGLKRADYGVVVLSKAFFSKRWTKAELNGMFSLETDNRKIILPVWHNVGADEVREFSPILADRVGVTTESGLDRVVHEIKVAVGAADRQKFLGKDTWKENFHELDQDITHRKASDKLSRSVEGVQKVEQVARAIISEAKSRAELLVRENSELKVRLVDTNDWHIAKDLSASIESNGIRLSLWFSSIYTNSAEGCRLEIKLSRWKGRDYSRDGSSYETQKHFQLQPHFDRNFDVYWIDDSNRKKAFTAGSAILDFAFEHFANSIREMLGQNRRR